MFKPFRPPLIRKAPGTDTPSTQTSSHAEPSAKRRRTGDGIIDLTVDDDTKGIPRPSSQHSQKNSKNQTGSRRPLVPVKNSPNADELNDSKATTTVSGGEAEASYFNVLW